MYAAEPHTFKMQTPPEFSDRVQGKRCLRNYGREEIEKSQFRFEAGKDGSRSAACAYHECHLSGNYGYPDSLAGLECIW